MELDDIAEVDSSPPDDDALHICTRNCISGFVCGARLPVVEQIGVLELVDDEGCLRSTTADVTASALCQLNCRPKRSVRPSLGCKETQSRCAITGMVLQCS